MNEVVKNFLVNRDETGREIMFFPETSVTPKESVITEENGFKNITEGKGSAYARVNMMHEQWKKENGYA